ncbi:hypothetical protein Pst134EA_031894 [Puccinia striiformis f. sp. tritici]|uniref:uncharacterized protein n=1 Tax=Puccinia striiformis f. sp. tritici TaxID=168172 RepID=UPI0020080F3F|nr:uncharacterized protein Pst134EA_031894 [Puccinia striiformis f. sp. tritici]KAH9442572.1 hypothetical protein Pst134EA_031894 [Puccinia striiformis f. sp. tritici]
MNTNNKRVLNNSKPASGKLSSLNRQWSTVEQKPSKPSVLMSSSQPSWQLDEATGHQHRNKNPLTRNLNLIIQLLSHGISTPKNPSTSTTKVTNSISFKGLVSLSPEQQNVLDLVLKGESIFFPGSAGAGGNQYYCDTS